MVQHRAQHSGIDCAVWRGSSSVGTMIWSTVAGAVEQGARHRCTEQSPVWLSRVRLLGACTGSGHSQGQVSTPSFVLHCEILLPAGFCAMSRSAPVQGTAPLFPEGRLDASRHVHAWLCLGVWLMLHRQCSCSSQAPCGLATLLQHHPAVLVLSACGSCRVLRSIANPA
jgi:hypothetical protein